MEAKIARVSPQEEQFAASFIRNPDLSEVARELNLSLKTAREYLKRPEVRKAIGLALLTERRDRLEEVRDFLLQELHQLSNFDLKDLYDEYGNLRTIPEMPDSVRCAIKGVKQGRYGMELTFYDAANIKIELLRLTLQALRQDDKTGGDQERTVLVIPADEE